MTTDTRNQTLARYIRTRRLSRELDVRTAAEQAGIDATYWWKLEAGQYESPSPKYLQRIADALGAPLTDLYALAGYEIPGSELPSFTPYLRSRYDDLPPEAVADLERYFELLRNYYDIPADQPVFPPKPREKNPRPNAAPSKDAVNSKDHPWRAA